MSESTETGGGAPNVGVVLVHGACHGAWCWEEVVGPLETAGFAVNAVDLPLTSLSSDADTVRSAVRGMKDAGLAVLVAGHSYGGVVITAGGHDADALMYCAAVLPDTGKTAADESSLLTTPEIAAASVVDAETATLSFDPARAVPALYSQCSAEQADAAVRRLRPTHLACFGEGIEDAAWRTVPASYVVCDGDRTVSPDYQRRRADVLGDTITLACDHSLFYSATDELVDRIVAVGTRLGRPDV